VGVFDRLSAGRNTLLAEPRESGVGCSVDGRALRATCNPVQNALPAMRLPATLDSEGNVHRGNLTLKTTSGSFLANGVAG
jgi:hypothetical protein